MPKEYIIVTQHEQPEQFNVIQFQVSFHIKEDLQNSIEQNKFNQKESKDQIESESTGQSLKGKEHDSEHRNDTHSPIYDNQTSINEPNSQAYNTQNEQIIYEEDMQQKDIQEQSAVNMQDTKQEKANQQVRCQKQNQQEEDKNDSKNVPKGLMKAIAKFVLAKDKKHKQFFKKFCLQWGVNQDSYLKIMDGIRKSHQTSIQRIRNFLTTDQYAKANRALVTFFLRKRFVSHIYNSKMIKHNVHIKYLSRWREIVKNPEKFYSLK